MCLDERPVQLHADVRAPIAAAPGREAKRDSEYKRRGTANVFAIVAPLIGKHLTYACGKNASMEAAIFGAVAAVLIGLMAWQGSKKKRLAKADTIEAPIPRPGDCCFGLAGRGQCDVWSLRVDVGFPLRVVTRRALCPGCARHRGGVVV